MTKSDVTIAEEWFTGEDTTIVFKIRNASTVAPQDITGWPIEWKLASALADEPILSIAAVITDAPNGVCEVTVPSAGTINLTPGTYFYDLRRTDPGSYALLAYGSVELLDPYVDEDPWKVL